MRLASGMVVTNAEKSADDEVKLIQSMAASDRDYTRQDAVMKEWRRQHSLYLQDSANWTREIMCPSEETLRELEKQFQTEGVQKGVDWDRLGFDIWGIGFHTPSNTLSLSSILGAGDLSRKADYLASRYAAVEDRIKKRPPAAIRRSR